MAYNTLLIFYLVVCNANFISATIYSCNRTADCGCSKYNANVYKIVGGENSFPSSWGWVVSLQIFGSHFCTGAIVSPLHVITAAHCVTDDFLMKFMNVVVGIDRLSETDDLETVQVRSVTDVFIHPSYNDTAVVNDIAVLRLNESLVISSEMATARLCLPRVVPSGREADYPANSASLVAIGWGTLESEAQSIPSDLHLQQVTLKAVPADDETCAEFITDPRSQFCAGVRGGGKGEKVLFHNVMKLFFIRNLDTCQGDSGGPLMRFESTQKRWVLAGVTSFGIGCGDPRFSGVYTRASVYLPWLRSVINDGFRESEADPYSAATENYCSIYIVVLSVAQLCFFSLWNK